MESHGSPTADFFPLTTPRKLRSVSRPAPDAGLSLAGPQKDATVVSMEVLDPLSLRDEWDCGLQDHPAATVFHTAAWARVLATTYGHRPCYLRFPQAKGPPALIPLMEVNSPVTGRRGVGLPFSDVCAPLLPAGMMLTGVQASLEALARDRRWKYLELRGGGLPATAAGPATPSFLGHELDLNPGPDALWNGLGSPVRRALRKARGHKLQLRVVHDETGLRDFFELHTLTRRRHGLPPQPWAFFRQILREKLIGPEAGFVVLAATASKPVAAAVFLRHGQGAVYKFGASDDRSWDCRPNNLVMWEGIRHLAATGARSLHFGRTSLGQDGLRRFKTSWGARETELSYVQFLPRTASWQPLVPRPVRPLVQALFHRLPLAVNRLAGRLLYPHLD